MKMYAVRFYAEIMVAYIDKIIKIYTENAKNAINRSENLDKCVTISRLILKLGVVIYTLAGLFYLLNPIYLYCTRREIVPLLPLYMPFIDETTKHGFILLSVLHLGFVFVAVVASAGSDLLYALVVINFFVPVNIFHNNIDELNTLLSKSKPNDKFIKAKLLNVIFIHREICE